MGHPLIQFSYLQLLDLLTTVAFLLAGVHEANPLVQFSFHLTSSPVSGLLLVKVMAIGMAYYCWRFGRQNIVSKMNLFFAALIAWNLVALILGTGAKLA